MTTPSMTTFPQVRKPHYVKDPDARLDFGFDYNDPAAVDDKGKVVGPWLAEGETIDTSTWLVPAGLTSDDDSHTTTTTTVWLLGGTAGSTYTVTNRITTSSGRIDDRSFLVKITDR